MEIWFVILISISISLLLNAIINLRYSSAEKKPSVSLPPGPLTVPIIGQISWLRKGLSEIEPILRSLHARLGPMVALQIGTRPAIFVADRDIAHQALVQQGAVFADRPPPLATSKVITSNQHNISSASYGATWRLLRRNLTSEILHPSRVRSYSHARLWVLQILSDRFRESNGVEAVRVVDHLHYAMFCLLVLMCFGDKLDEKQIKRVEYAQRRLLLGFSRFNLLNFWPKITKILLRNRWKEFFEIRKEQEDVLLPLIRARKKIIEEKEKSTNNHSNLEEAQDYVLAYVDTLINLELPEEKRKLTEDEMVSLCSEFLNAGTDTTATALQWIMANLVKFPNIQEQIFAEMKEIVGDNGGLEEIREEDLQKMVYLKAVILEGLRRHPPGHFVLPHSVTNDTVLGGYLVPKKGAINFMVAEMGWDPKVWEDPMAFKPERFLRDGKLENIDITGSSGIKMMPFGAGRRICPAFGLAMLHLEYYVANLVWRFEWRKVEDDAVDLSEKQEFTMVMKNPLKAYVVPRTQVKA